MILDRIIYYLNLFFFFYMFVYALVIFFNTICAAFTLEELFAKKKYINKNIIENENNYIPISIIVPAYNEEVTILSTIESLRKLDYPEIEIVVVNDGSKDDTCRKVIEYYNLKEVIRPIRKQVQCKDVKAIYENQGGIRIILADKENGGKSDALNMGINLCKYPLFICVDADSALQHDSLKKIVAPFLESDEVVAVGGNIKVANQASIKDGKIVEMNTPKKLIVIFQIIEYFRVFLTSRVAFNHINANLIISGAFGIYSKRAVIDVGGYSPGIVGEDMDLVVKLHAFYRKNKLPYKITYVPDAICWSQVPESLSVLRAQRKRWHVGLGQALKAHDFMLFRPGYGTVGMIAYPYFLLFEYITPILELLGLATITLSFMFNFINIKFFLTYLLFYIIYNIVASLVAILLETYIFGGTLSFKAVLKLVIFSFVECVGFRQLCSMFRIGAFFGRKKSRNNWGNMKRVKMG